MIIRPYTPRNGLCPIKPPQTERCHPAPNAGQSARSINPENPIILKILILTIF